MASDDSMSPFCLDELWDCEFLTNYTQTVSRHMTILIHGLYYSQFDVALNGSRFHQMFPFDHTFVFSLRIHLADDTHVPVFVRRQSKDPTHEKMDKNLHNKAWHDYHFDYPLCGSDQFQDV